MNGNAALKRSPHSLLRSACELGATLVPFAGYEMPVQYPTGILTEHNWTRRSRGALRCLPHGPGLCCRPRSRRQLRAASKSWFPATSRAWRPQRIRYTQFTNPEGGIIDDLMVTRSAERRAGSILSSMPRARMSTMPGSREHLAGRCEARADRRSRARCLAGAEGGSSHWRATAPKASKLAFMTARPVTIRWHCMPMSRARAIPARTVSRFRSATRMRCGSGETSAGRPRCEANRPRRA